MNGRLSNTGHGIVFYSEVTSSNQLVSVYSISDLKDNTNVQVLAIKDLKTFSDLELSKPKNQILLKLKLHYFCQLIMYLNETFKESISLLGIMISFKMIEPK